MTLQLLLTHYKESDKIVKRMLDSIEAHMPRISPENFSVSIVSDGLENRISETLLSAYSYGISYSAYEHRGARFARNSLLENATADYVMFCDIDDCFTGTSGLSRIFQEMEKCPDVITSPIFLEYPDENGSMSFRVAPSRNAVWLGGDAFKASYLRENGICFDEVLNYGEKYFLWQAFNFTDNIISIPEKMYIYKYNVGSLSRSEPYFRVKNFYKFMGTLDLIAERLKAIGRSDLLEKFLSESIAFAYVSARSKWINDSEAPAEYSESARKSSSDYAKKWGSYVHEIDQYYMGMNFLKQSMSIEVLEPVSLSGMIDWVDDLCETP